MRGYSALTAEHEGTPLGINVAIGSLALIGATLVATALFPPDAVTGRLVVTAVAVGGYAVVVEDNRATLIVAGLGYLLFDGFLVNRQGGLTWDGMMSIWHLMVLSTAVGLGLGLRWIRLARADRRRAVRKAIMPVVQTTPVQTKPVQAKPTEEEARSA